MSVSSGVTLVAFNRLVFNELAFNKIAFLIHYKQQGSCHGQGPRHRVRLPSETHVKKDKRLQLDAQGEKEIR